MVRSLPLAAAVALLGCSGGSTPGPAEKAPAQGAKPARYSVGDAVTLGTHDDLAGGPAVDLRKELEKSGRGLVLVWYSPICPACIAHAAEIVEFAKEYEAKGWKFIGVFSGMNGPPDKLTPDQHREKYAEQRLSFPVLDDRRQVYKKPFSLRRTPTFAAITKDGRLGFIGAPWNADAPEEEYLGPWLDATLEGKEPPKFPDDQLVPWG